MLVPDSGVGGWERRVFSPHPPQPHRFCVLENSSARTSSACRSLLYPLPSRVEPSASVLVMWAHGAVLLRCRHMVLLKEQYGKQVVVNLLGSRGGEEVLNRAFKVKALGVLGEGGEGPLLRGKLLC